MRRLALLLVSMLVAAEAAAESADTRALRLRFDQAAASFRKGDMRRAGDGFQAVATALEPEFLAGSFRPVSGDPRWVLYGSSILMLSDIHRYRLQEPRRARELEAKLATEAERLGYVDLAAAEWLAVGDIERFDLDDPAAARRSYERVPGLGGGAVDATLANQALQGMARTKGGQTDALQQARLDVPLSPQHVEAVSLVVPHLPVYAVAGGESTYAAFAKAHPKSYRAALAEYAAFLLEIVFRGEDGDGARRGHDAFLAHHPDDVLAVTVCETMAAHYEREGQTQAAVDERERSRALKRRLGLGPAPRPTTQSGTGTPSAFERRGQSPVAPAAQGRRQEVC